MANGMMEQLFPDHSNSWSEGGGADHPAAGQRRQLRLGDRRRRLHRADAARAQEGPQPGRKAQGHLPKGYYLEHTCSFSA